MDYVFLVFSVCFYAMGIVPISFAIKVTMSD